MPMLLPIVIIFVIWLQYEKSKTERSERNASAEFWHQEQKANTIRKKNIDHLNYITIPLEELPITDSDNEDIRIIQEELIHLSQQKILNLNNYTNTQLKLKYGVGNLDVLITYDGNFMRLICLLSKWGTCLYKAGLLSEAITVLEYGIKMKTDIKNNYTLLASIYKEKGEKSKINALIQQAEQIETLMKASIINELTQILNS